MKRLLLLLPVLLLLTGCSASVNAEASATADVPAAIDTKSMDFTFTDRELSGAWEAAKAVAITGSGSTLRIGGKGAAMVDGQLRITAEGVYCLTGAFTDIPIVISAGEKDKVQLVLNNADVTVSEGPAILVESADKVFITLPEDTASTITDGASYPSQETYSPDGAIFSRADLCLNGSGSLTVTGSYRHGVVSKDDLVIVACTLRVSSVSTALDGKDCVMITGAAITLEAGSNGVRSDNTEDENRGFVYLKDCNLSIVSGGDGVQAATVLRAEDVNLTLRAGQGSSYSLRYADDSRKGLKSGGDMLLNGGSYQIDSQDDCIHSNSSIVIAEGTFTLASGDDGIHADTDLTISGGSLLISKSYEGLEASKLTIAGGVIDITASDDGLNAAGGADGSSMGGRFGRGMFSNGVGEIFITGGYIVINASGDGIDSNADIHVSGGVTLVSGPVSSGNAAFDYDGSATVTGGILIAAGPTGMAQSFSAAENQGAMLLTISRGQGGQSIALVDENGRVVVSFTPENTYQSIVITAPGVQEGASYTLVSGGTVEGADEHGFSQDAIISGGTTLGSITMTSLLYGGTSGMWNQPGGSGGGGGWPGGGGGGGGWPGGGGGRPGGW